MSASIKKNFFYSTILTGANYIFPLIVFPYVSRVLGVNNIGLCNFAAGIVQCFILFSMMGIGTVGIRETAKNRNDKESLSKCFSKIFAINTILTTITIAVYIVCIYYIPKFHENSRLMWIGAIQLVFNYFLVEWLYKGLEEFRYITLRTIVVRSLYVISVFVFIHDESDYELYFLLTSLVVLLNAAINFIYSSKYVKLSFRELKMDNYWNQIMILGVYAVLTSMYTTFNIGFLGFTAGETEVGYYTTATKLFAMAFAAYTALTGVMLPRMSSLVAQGKLDEFKGLLAKTTDILLEFSIPIIFFVMVFAPEIIKLIAGTGYEGAIIPMRIVMPLLFIIGYEQIIVIQALMPLQKDKAILINSIVGATVGLTGNILLVTRLGSIGSAIVWLSSELIVLVMAQNSIRKSIGIRFPFRRFIANLIEYVPLFVLISLCLVLPFYYIWRLLVGCCLTICYIVVVQFLVKRRTIVKRQS